MKKYTMPLVTAASLLAASTASSETLAGWFPTVNDGPRGLAYGNSLNSPGADITSEGILWTSAFRSLRTGWTNGGAVWSGATSLTGFSPDEYTSYSLEVAPGSEVQIDSFFVSINTYSAERETINAGTVDEEIVLSTIQMRLRSSLDGFAADIGSVASLPEERVDANNIPFTIDLTEVAELQSVTEPIEFRVYMWEESTVAGYNPFIWLDLASGGCVVEGEVLSEVNREVLAAIIPTSAAVGAPGNSTAVEPEKKVLSDAVGSITASRPGTTVATNARSVWPGSVNTTGFDETVYLETTVDPAPGSSISVTNLVINAFTPYTTMGTAGWAASLRSSLDGFAADVATTSGVDTFEVAFDLASRFEFRSLAGPVTFRVYLWDVEPTDGSAYDPFMFVDIEGSDFGEFLGIQVIGTTGDAALSPPTVASAVFTPGTGFVVEAANLVIGRSYDLFISFDLTDPEGFSPLEIEQEFEGAPLTFIDRFANFIDDPKVFYRIGEAIPR